CDAGRRMDVIDFGVPDDRRLQADRVRNAHVWQDRTQGAAFTGQGAGGRGDERIGDGSGLDGTPGLRPGLDRGAAREGGEIAKDAHRTFGAGERWMISDPVAVTAIMADVSAPACGSQAPTCTE